MKSLHGLLNELFESYEEMIEDIHKFESIIENSSLKSEDWKKNGKMRGLSSEAGFKIIREIIKIKNLTNIYGSSWFKFYQLIIYK